MITSALGARVVVTIAPTDVPSLLPGVGSGVLEVLRAVLLTLPELGAMKLIVRVVLTTKIGPTQPTTTPNPKVPNPGKTDCL